MKDKYNNEIKKIIVDDCVKERLLNIIENKKEVHKIKFSYAMVGVFILLVTVTCVYAQDIGNLIKKWGGIDRTTENGVIVHDDEKDSITTNVDNLMLDSYGYHSDFMNINDIENYLGVKLLKLKNEYKKDNNNSFYDLSVSYNYDSKTNAKPQVIRVFQYGYTKNNKRITFNQELITKNFPQEYKDSFNQDTGFNYKDLKYVDTIKLENINTEATIYMETRMDEKQEFYDVYKIEFNYNNIKYSLNTVEILELDDMIDVLNNLEK